MTDLNNKILSIEALTSKAKELKKNQKKIIFCEKLEKRKSCVFS